MASGMPVNRLLPMAGNRIAELIHDRLKTLSMDMKEASLRIGKNHAYLQQYLTRGIPRSLPEAVRENLGEVLQINPDELREGGSRSQPKKGGREIVLPPRRLPAARAEQAVEFEGTRYLGVKYYDARVQAGAGGESTDEILDRYLFREASLRRITTAPLDQLGIVEVDGDSMEPTLRSGDQALVDLTQNRPTRKDGIYVLRSDDGLQVKRIAANPVSKKLTIKCDNERYPEYTDVPLSKVVVLGRVVWIGRRI